MHGREWFWVDKIPQEKICFFRVFVAKTRFRARIDPPLRTNTSKRKIRSINNRDLHCTLYLYEQYQLFFSPTLLQFAFPNYISLFPISSSFSLPPFLSLFPFSFHFPFFTSPSPFPFPPFPFSPFPIFPLQKPLNFPTPNLPGMIRPKIWYSARDVQNKIGCKR